MTYFIHRDLFPALMKVNSPGRAYGQADVLQYSHDHPENSSSSLVLLGLLANYNKFESQNLYQNRLEDFVNEDTIRGLVYSSAHTCSSIRDQYVSVQNDVPAAWTVNSTLAYVGLRALSSEAKKPEPTEDEAKGLFNALPSAEAAILLSAYSFVQGNKIFASGLVTLPADRSGETPLSAFLSSTSYIADHAHRSGRASTYAIFNLLVIRMLVEDNVLVKKLCSKDSQTTIRLCRQRTPHLPPASTSRIPATAILDICTATMSHNLRKRLDIPLYSILVSIILRLLTHLESTKTRLHHHWPYLWGTLLTLTRFLATYSNDLSHARDIRSSLCAPLTSLLAFSLSKGDAFLPDPASYDDLFYKLIEARSILLKFRDAYCKPSSPPDSLTRSINALINVANHYHTFLAAQHGGKRTHQSPAAIQKVIKEGHETLDMGGDEGFGTWERWRENSWKASLKQMIRVAVEDARVLALQ